MYLLYTVKFEKWMKIINEYLLFFLVILVHVAQTMQRLRWQQDYRIMWNIQILHLVWIEAYKSIENPSFSRSRCLNLNHSRTMYCPPGSYHRSLESLRLPVYRSRTMNCQSRLCRHFRQQEGHFCCQPPQSWNYCPWNPCERFRRLTRCLLVCPCHLFCWSRCRMTSHRRRFWQSRNVIIIFTSRDSDFRNCLYSFQLLLGWVARISLNRQMEAENTLGCRKKTREGVRPFDRLCSPGIRPFLSEYFCKQQCGKAHIMKYAIYSQRILQMIEYSDCYLSIYLSMDKTATAGPSYTKGRDVWYVMGISKKA